jgi:hypothetical protein
MAFEDYWFSKTDEPVGASLRFSGAQSLSRPVSVTESSFVTFSVWVKRGSLGATQVLFGENGTVGPFNYSGSVSFGSTDTLNASNIANFVGPSISSPGVYRDPGAWQHVMLTQNGASPTFNLYSNGVL